MSLVKEDFLLLIMNCQKYREKALKQKQTWLSTIQIKYYHVLGNPDLTTEFEFSEDERILWVKTLDDYNSLPKKVIASYKAVATKYQFEYILKTDDDQQLTSTDFFKNIIHTISNLTPKPHYGGKVIDIQRPYYSKYNLIHPELPENLPILPTQYCNGRFYFLSKEAVQYLLLKQTNIEKEYLEDYAIGFHLHPMFKKTMCQIDSDKVFVDF
jgi:hypothetical protein